MPVLYFYRLSTSVATSAFRDAIWRVVQDISDNPQIARRPLIVLDTSADPSPEYKHPGHGYIEIPTEKMVDLILARLKVEPIVFQSKTVEFTREQPSDLETISVQQPHHEAIRSGSSSAPPWRAGRYTNQTMVNGPQRGSRHHGVGANVNHWRQPGHGTQEIRRGNPTRSKGREHRPPVPEYRASLERLEFGVLRGKNFSVEYSRSLAEEGGWMTFEDNNSIHVTIGNLPKDLSGPRLAIFNSSIAHIGLGTEGGSSYMFLVLSHNPNFQKGNTWNQFTGSSDRNRGGIWVKHSCLDKNHEPVAPYTSRWIRLVFDQKSDRRAIPNIETCQLANIPVTPILDPPLTFDGFDLYSRSNIETALGWLRSGSLDWHVAFQCEALFRNGILTPYELLSLRQLIEELAEEFPQRACDALKTFGAEIVDLRARCKFDDIKSGDIAEDFNKHVHNNQKLTPPERLQKGLRKTDFLCHHVKVTPTAVHLAGPLVEPSNRVIRKYPGFESYFILVSLTDEKGYKTHRFARERLEKFLKHGIQLGDRHYELLAFSQSGLQEHSCYFSAPFTYNGQRISVQLIRDGIGSFGDLIYCPARYGARMSQAFSSTNPSVVLDESTIRYIHDFHDRTGIRTFTDGCATISQELAKEVWERMLEHSPQTHRYDLGPTPCAFQIKMGGSEGVVRVDPRLQGRVLSLRPSMTKFDAPGEFSLEVARALLIMLLWSGGVDSAVFETLMRQNLETMVEGMRTCAGVADQFMWNRLGAAFHLDRTFRKLARLRIELDQPGVRTSGLGKILNGALHHFKQQLKYDAQIEVPDSYTLVGVCDEHKYLRFNEVYVCVQHLNRRTGKTELRYLRGRVLVARSPVVHPGDAQVLFAIGKPPPDSPFAGEGNNLPNCVVFSCLGGDMYHVIAYQQLIPQHIYAPAEYATIRPKRVDTPSTIEDLADFIVDVRVVTIDHLEIASRSELRFRDEKCLANAKILSKAVDFVQSGYWVNRNETYRRNREESSSNANGRRQGPDWQAGHNSDRNDDNYYECPSVLGRLFRSVELSLGDHTPHSDTIEQDPVGIRECIFRHAVLHMTAIQESTDKFDNAISALRLRYTTELNQICTSLSKRVSEVQVMIGTNFEGNSNSHLMERVKRSTSALADFVRLELKGGEDELPHEWLARAWKAYLLTSQLGDQVFGALSFSWLALESVLDALQALDENFLPDEESQGTPCVEVEYPTATGNSQPDNNHPPIQIDTNDRYSNRGSNYRGSRGSGFGNSRRPRGRPRM